MVGLLALLDDIAILMKVAAKKTTGVLGDDLALNAEQLNGISPDRELPIVWRVFKGSLLNKLILVPIFIVVSLFAPMLVIPLLMIGGAFLCFEGVEKVLEKFMHTTPHLDSEKVITETERVNGAVKTDFILSAEIIVIALGAITEALKNSPSTMNLIVAVSVFSILMTFGVYGFVALLIKIDDLGIYLSKTTNTVGKSFGKFLMHLAPFLMKALGIVGTAAMFLVGGGIISHGIPVLGHSIQSLILNLNPALQFLISTTFDALVGIILGLIIVGFVTVVKKIKGKKKPKLTKWTTAEDIKNMKENKEAFVKNMGEETYQDLLSQLENSEKNK